MHGIKPTLALTAALATLFVGCEWTGTSDSGSWSSSYDAMNFSGTYRAVTTATSTTTTTTTDSTGSSSTANTTVTESKGGSDSFGKTSVSKAAYAGTLSNANIVPGSVAVKIGNKTAFVDNAEGGLNGSGVNGSGNIVYQSGTFQFSFLTSPPDGDDIVVTYKYYVDASGRGDSGSSNSSSTTTTTRSGSSVSAITVSQNGQNLTMTLNNGIVMKGKFTNIQQTGKVNQDTNAGYNTYNAQFEVRTTDNKFVGSLNYDLQTGFRMLNGTWTWGKSTYDVQAVGPAWVNSADASTLSSGVITK